LIPLGLIIFCAACVATFFPLLYGVILVLDEHYFIAAVVLLVSPVWIRFGLRLLRWLLSGIEYADL